MLVSWKEIATYLRVSVCTAQRLERQMNLPVRRRNGSSKAMVFALENELEDWSRDRLVVRQKLAARSRAVEWLLQGARDAVTIADDGRRFVGANRAACRLLGRTRDELLTMRIDDVVTFSEAELESIWASFVSNGQREGVAEFQTPSGPRMLEFRSMAHYLPGRHLCVMRAMRKARSCFNQNELRV